MTWLCSGSHCIHWVRFKLYHEKRKLDMKQWRLVWTWASLRKTERKWKTTTTGLCSRRVQVSHWPVVLTCCWLKAWCWSIFYQVTVGHLPPLYPLLVRAQNYDVFNDERRSRCNTRTRSRVWQQALLLTRWQVRGWPADCYLWLWFHTHSS